MNSETLEQRARSASSKITEHLASLVMAPQTEDQFDADVLPRDFVMSAVQSVKHWTDELCSVAAEYKSALESTPAQWVVTDEMVDAALGAMPSKCGPDYPSASFRDGWEAATELVEQEMPAILTAALSARTAPAEGDSPRNREADRARFPDADFNAWLDAGITDCGHTVYDQIGSIVDAWQGWNAHVVSMMLDSDPIDFDTARPAKAEGDAQDAARYRWLCANRHVLLITGFFGNACINRTIEEVSAHIDAKLADTARTVSRGDA